MPRLIQQQRYLSSRALASQCSRTTARFDSLKDISGSDKAFISVTQNRMVDNPNANMPIGFARSALWEVPVLRYRFVDSRDVHKLDARVLVETVLRFQASGSVQEQSRRYTLWSIESKIVPNSNERQLILRLPFVSDANDSYNSARRTITKQIQPQNCLVAIFSVYGRCILREQSTADSGKPTLGANTTASSKPSYSSLRAVRTVLRDVFAIALNTGSSRLSGLAC